MTTRQIHITTHRLRRNLIRGRVVLFSIGLPLVVAYSLAIAAGSVWKSLLVLIGFGSVIFFHELGHFLAAKAFGVRCDVNLSGGHRAASARAQASAANKSASCGRATKP